MCKDYREKFLEWIKKTAIYPKLSEDDIESSLFIAKCWLNNDKFGFHPARYNRKSLARLIASQFCWYIKDQRIAELEEKLKNAIRFKTPYVERFAVVQYVHRQGKPYKIEHCYDCYKDENMETIHCYYDCDSYNFRVIQICDTEEEALEKLEELKGE